MPAVSVIVPAWNAEAYLGATIESVLAQTMDDFELLIVDDGSVDGTHEVARRYERKDARVRLLTQPNGGPSPARNHGMGEARGAWLAFLDSDDLWLPTFLAAQLDVARRHPDVDLITANGRYLGGPFDGRPVRPVVEGAPTITLLDLIQDEASVFIMTVFRRVVFETIGGLDTTLLTNEDYEFWIRAARAGFRFRRNPAPLGWYRQRGESLSSSEVRMVRGILHVFTEIGPTLDERGPERAALDRQVRRFSAELLAAEARAALERGDALVAADRLARLRDLGGGLHLAAAEALLRTLPRTAIHAYQLRAALRRARAPRSASVAVMAPAGSEAR